MSDTFSQLYDRFALASFDRQLMLADRHHEQEWNFDKARSELEFADDSVTYAVQVLGIEDHIKRVWRWGWADPMSDFPRDTLVAAHSLNEYGQSNQIIQLSQGELSLEDVTGEEIALVASGFSNAKAYFPLGFPGQGAVYLLITDDELPMVPDCSLPRVSRVIIQAVESCSLQNHHSAIQAFLSDRGYLVETDGNCLVAKQDGATRLKATFDSMNRLTSLDLE